MYTYLSNAFSIQMLDGDVTVSFARISAEEAREILSYGFTSAIGHPDTANVVSGILRIPVPVNRISVKLGNDDRLIVAQYVGPRLPEGATELPSGARIEFYKVVLSK